MVLFLNVHGRVYIKHNAWFDYRLPGFGAEPVNSNTAPELYASDYNTPFKGGQYDNHDHFAQDIKTVGLGPTRP